MKENITVQQSMKKRDELKIGKKEKGRWVKTYIDSAEQLLSIQLF